MDKGSPKPTSLNYDITTIFGSIDISQSSSYARYEARESFCVEELYTVNAAPWTLYLPQDKLCAQNFLHALVWGLSKEFEISLYFLVNIQLRKKKKKKALLYLVRELLAWSLCKNVILGELNDTAVYALHTLCALLHTVHKTRKKINNMVLIFISNLQKYSLLKVYKITSSYLILCNTLSNSLTILSQ